MSILDSVLSNCKPPEWEVATYTSKVYNLFDLCPSDDEYEEVVKPFQLGSPRLTVTALQRYQNPFLLGRFKIRKEQLAFRGQSVQEMKYYHAVSKQDLNKALDYNMDVRRYSDKYCCTGDHKNPKFYHTPGAAYSNHRGSSDKAILICKVLGSYNEHTTYKTNDAEYMPIYVVEI